MVRAISRTLLGLGALCLLAAACSKSSSGGFDDGSSGSSGRDSGTRDTGALSDGASSSGDSGADAAIPLAKGALDAHLVTSPTADAGDTCLDRLALKLGTLSPLALLANGDPNGGNAVTVACTVTPATGAFSVSFGVASGVSFGAHGTGGPTAELSNDASRYAADGCTIGQSDISGDKVILSLKCGSTLVGGGSSGAPAPSPCELDAEIHVEGCVTR